ncbi:hypothetical protein [Kribbella sp. NPDC049584]|uniref:hypothetical protein n=1 Tax=Kribbella sp. NPDC049584 TaxID=3154833 RepID=UPI0034449ABB
MPPRYDRIGPGTWSTSADDPWANPVDGEDGVVQALSRRTRLRSWVQALRNGVRGARFVSGFINSSTGDGGVTGAGFSGVL